MAVLPLTAASGAAVGARSPPSPGAVVPVVEVSAVVVEDSEVGSVAGLLAVVGLSVAVVVVDSAVVVVASEVGPAGTEEVLSSS